MARCEPERMIDDATLGAFGYLRKGRRPRRLFPAVPEIGGTEDGRAEVTCLGGRQKGTRMARVGDDMINDMAEEVRPIYPPSSSRGIGMKQPRSFPRSDENQEPTSGHPRA